MLLAPSAVKAASWGIEEKQILKGLRKLIALALDIGARIWILKAMFSVWNSFIVGAAASEIRAIFKTFFF